ncbi:amidase [Erythrobacter sp. QSSC1-22B]|uniref:creatininase family protein n=1 Tax=Erythrobacter sp. QSSC1-22B TaxID=1860125 RepID=UPI000805A0EF|nr:creatininase family protein [Erythrobacter sp. QSSC1-22B]OBX17979.1 amidase [Erythrobacter sp. QSSC1-22B]
MRLDLMSWPEVDIYLKGRNDIVVPIGSTEQHGPNGLVGTDALCAEVIGRAVGEKAAAVVAPTISIGMAQHHLGFPGSMSLRPSTLLAVVRDVIASLAQQGFLRISFVNGHGGNIATVTAAFAEFYSETSFSAGRTATRVECRLRNWWEAPSVQTITSELFGDAEGMHATASEVSVTQFAFPNAIKRVDLDPEIAPTGVFTDAVSYCLAFPDGRIGSNPTLASPEAGARLVEAAASDLAVDHLKWIGRHEA